MTIVTPDQLTLATVAMTPNEDPSISRQILARIVKETVLSRPEIRLIHFGETILGWFHKKGESEAYHQRIAETIPGETTEFVAGLAREYQIYISFGLSERGEEKLHNSQVLISPNGEILAQHRKFIMRSKAFSPGERILTTANVDGVKVALVICADVRSWPLFRAIRRAKPTIVLAGLADWGTSLLLNRMLGTFYDSWTVVANRHSQEDAIHWPGLITITNPTGKLVAHGIGKEQVVFHAIPVRRVRSFSRIVRRFYTFFKALVLGVLIGLEAIKKKLRSSGKY
ncbi:carbon-nitrogen hydrolase family protein [Candidatus Bipolaricaulota bacterium]